MADKNMPKTNRRKVLRAIGGTAAVGAVTGTASAETPRMEGFAYDPTTHEILGEASATVSRNPHRLTGTLRVQGTQFNLSKLSAKEIREIPTSKSKLTLSKFEKNLPGHLQNRIEIKSAMKGGLTGFVRMSEMENKIAFALVDKSNGGSPDKLLQKLERTAIDWNTNKPKK